MGGEERARVKEVGDLGGREGREPKGQGGREMGEVRLQHKQVGSCFQKGRGYQVDKQHNSQMRMLP